MAGLASDKSCRSLRAPHRPCPKPLASKHVPHPDISLKGVPRIAATATGRRTGGPNPAGASPALPCPSAPLRTLRNARPSSAGPLNARGEPVWCPRRGPRRRSGIAVVRHKPANFDRTPPAEFAKSPPRGQRAQRGGGGAPVETGGFQKDNRPSRRYARTVAALPNTRNNRRRKHPIPPDIDSRLSAGPARRRH
jgi:hypothetical protein